jgi:methyl-accepting chemotaxis protein
MPNVTIATTLKAVIGLVALALLGMLAIEAWTAQERLTAASRIERVASASRDLFSILPLVRVDRVNTQRDLSTATVTPAAMEQATKTRAAIVPTILKAAEALDGQPFPKADALLPALAGQAKRVQALMDETAAAYRLPKDSRRAGLSDEYQRESSRLLDLLNENTATIAAWIKLQDSLVDKLFDVKAMLWNVRVTAGELGGLINLAVAGVNVPADSVAQFDKAIAKTRGIWESAKSVLEGVPVDGRVSAAMARGEAQFLNDGVLGPMRAMLASIVAGGKAGVSADVFNADILPRLASLLEPANLALDVAIEQATAQRAVALRTLIAYAGILAAGLLIVVTAFVVIARRVVRPLHVIRDRMARLADGELTIEAPYAERGDEIGALGRTMAVFRDKLTDGERLRAERADDDARAAARRRQEMHALADHFDEAVGSVVGLVASAATQLESSARTLSATAEETSAQSTSVAAASEQASANVASVASATEELSASVSEISRQVAQSAEVAGLAVTEANETTGRVKGLAIAADRIGSIVGLINTIAGQTNLLALNATIEAARAGEAGRGFAVVANEVKALADQTAKATAEISAQVGAIQEATAEAAEAIERIGSTIGRMNTITATIASAVDGQGIATVDIARNVQEASRGTADVSGSIAGVTTAAAESSAAASQVQSSAAELGRQAEVLRGEVAQFLAHVRAA